MTTSPASHQIAVALLTGGGDRPYAFGLATELVAKEVALDLIGSDDLNCPDLQGRAGVKFLNLRGSQRPDVGFASKVIRLSLYYAKLIRYAATAKAKIFHILWNNKFEFFDRTLLMLYYFILGKKTVLTVHNVNAEKRDSRDTLFNRLTLRIQYKLANHIFVHTEKMKSELADEYGVPGAKITVIPFGINNAAPNTRLLPGAARRRLGILGHEKVILFFGNIAPYKGLEYLINAFQQVSARDQNYRLIIGGRPKNCETYWKAIQNSIQQDLHRGRVVLRAEFIPDDETEVYFKAADVLVLPYKHIYQSGVLFLGYSFGLPVLAADVGSLREEIIEGKTGFVFRPEDPNDLARAIDRYFESDLFANLHRRRKEIRDYATGRHSWDLVGHATLRVYEGLLRMHFPTKLSDRRESKTSIDMDAP